MDEVLADVHHKFLELYHRDFNIPPSLKQLPGKELHENLPIELHHQWKVYINEKGFFRDLPVIPDAREVLEELHKTHEIYIVSAAMEFRNSLEDKFDWLRDNFPFIEWTHILFTGHKIIQADVLIDDRAKNFDNFPGRKLLYTSPHNLLLTDYERVNNWIEVADKFNIKRNR